MPFEPCLGHGTAVQQRGKLAADGGIVVTVDPDPVDPAFVDADAKHTRTQRLGLDHRGREHIALGLGARCHFACEGIELLAVQVTRGVSFDDVHEVDDRQFAQPFERNRPDIVNTAAKALPVVGARFDLRSGWGFARRRDASFLRVDSRGFIDRSARFLRIRGQSKRQADRCR